jgi:hypothetical protein
MLLLMTIRSTAGLPEQSAQPCATHDLRQMRTFPAVADLMITYVKSLLLTVVHLPC